MPNKLSNNQRDELALWYCLAQLAQEFESWDSAKERSVVCDTESGEITLEVEFESGYFKYNVRLNTFLMRVQFEVEGNPYRDMPFSYGRTAKFLKDAIARADMLCQVLCEFNEPDLNSIQYQTRVD